MEQLLLMFRMLRKRKYILFMFQNHEKQVILLMFQNGEGSHCLAVKKTISIIQRTNV